MIRDAIAALVDGRDLSEEVASATMEEIMSGEATPAQLGAFLVALRLKGETAEEIAGMARVMREKALRVSVDGPLLDTCGTGGDARGTFNVSTAAAFVAAGARARRPPRHIQREHRRRLRRGGRRRARCQARQPRDDQRLRQRRRAGGARRQDRA